MTTRTPIFRIPLLAAVVAVLLAATGEGTAQAGPTGGEWHNPAEFVAFRLP
jgi:hypothetical protein